MPGWSARRAAIGRLWVTTVSAASSGRAAARRATVVPASRIIVPSVGQFGEGGLRDAVLLVGRGGLALGEVGLEVETAGRDGAAVHPADEAGAVEGLQVAPDGLGGDLELLGQGQRRPPGRRHGRAGGSPAAAPVRTCPFASDSMPEPVVSLEATPGFPESKQVRARLGHGRTSDGHGTGVRQSGARHLEGAGPRSRHPSASRPAAGRGQSSARPANRLAAGQRTGSPALADADPSVSAAARPGRANISRKITTSTAATQPSAYWKASTKAGPDRGRGEIGRR